MLRGQPLPKQCYLAVHDAMKKVDKSATVSAFVNDKKKFQCEMLCQLPSYEDSPVFTRNFAMKLQEVMPLAKLAAKKRRIDIEFEGTKLELSVQMGMPNVTIEDVNAELEYEARIPLRSSLGFDEERFNDSAPPKATMAAVLLEKWAHDQFEPDFRPHPMYWLAHSYRMLEAFPHFDHHQLVYGGVRDKFWTLYEVAPFDNPFCDGEDMNTLRTARNLCRRMYPMWDSTYELVGDKTVLYGSLESEMSIAIPKRE